MPAGQYEGLLAAVAPLGWELFLSPISLRRKLSLSRFSASAPSKPVSHQRLSSRSPGSSSIVEWMWVIAWRKDTVLARLDDR